MLKNDKMNDKILDMEELSVGNPELHEYFASNTTLIDLSHIKSAEEFEILRNVIISQVNNTVRNGFYFRKYVIQPFMNVITKYNNTGLFPFFKEVYHSKESRLRKLAAPVLRYIRETNPDKHMTNIICIKNLPIAPERMGSKTVKTLNFTKVKNPANQALIKEWAMFLLMKSNLTIATIYDKTYHTIKALNQYDKNCSLWTDTDIQTCFNDILAQTWSNTTKRLKIISITDFFTFLTENNYILSSSAWLLASEIKIKDSRTYKKTAPNEYILNQIFNSLKNADDFIKLSFLILYCTGMRVSELRNLKRNCLDIRENATFIKYYQTKMRKEVSNVIPPVLSDMIQTYINNYPKNTKYLFKGKPGKAISIATINHRLKMFFKKHNIKNEDGTPYNFLAHSFRHLMAVRMHQYKIPYRYIQEQLHHKNPEMTLFYIEHLNEERIKKMSEWINNKGQKITPEQLTFDIHKAQIETAILPNGLCTRPASLPSCQHCNTCLSCNYFTTSKEWLPVLKNQEQRLKGFLESAEKQGWDKAVANNHRTLEQLKNIISKLEVS